jgi:cardiolipin synthase (CMP-forming)
VRITANQVTFARLVLMPALAGLIYGGEQAQQFATVLGILVGCTDFVDGWLARKQGPTILGGLMDPVADKVFIAVCFVPFADRGYISWQLVAALFLREYMVTALRSSFERRQRQLRSTWMSKMKTWVQMSTLGLLMMMLVVHSRTVLTAIFVTLAVAPLVGGIVFRVLKGTWWRGSVVGVLAHGTFAFIYIRWGSDGAALALAVFMVSLTWVSAWDYMAAAREVIAHPTAFDLARLLTAVALPIVGMLALAQGAAPAWAVVAIFALEFAHGGLDNLLAHHGEAASGAVWGGRLAVTVAALGLSLLVPAWGVPLGSLAFAVSLAGTVATFWNKRRFYLEAKHRDKKRPVAEPASL